jgi:hypothetical protein
MITVIEALLAALRQNDEPQLSKEQRKRLKCRTRGQRRIIRLRAVNQATLGGRQRR